MVFPDIQIFGNQTRLWNTQTENTEDVGWWSSLAASITFASNDFRDMFVMEGLEAD